MGTVSAHTARRGRKKKWAALVFAFVGGLAALVMFATVFSLSGRADDQQGTVAKLISQLLSREGSVVKIGAVDGPLSSNTTIRSIAISDRDGVWLKLDKVRLVWSRLALLRRRLEVDRLEIGKLEILRRPAPSEKIPDPAAGDQPIALPELPLKVIVKAFKLDELVLGPTVAGVPLTITASGALLLGPPSEGLDANIAIRRLDREGQSSIKLVFVPKTQKLDVQIKHREAPGGLIANLASLPGLPKVSLDVDGSGPLDDWKAQLDFIAGKTVGAKGGAQLKRSGDQRALTLDIDSRIEGLLPPFAAAIFSGQTKLNGVMRIGDSGAIDLEGLRLASALAELKLQGKITPEKAFDVALKMQALPNQNGKVVHRDVSIGKLAFDGTASGTFDKPVAQGKFEAREISAPPGSLNSLVAEFDLRPDGNGKNLLKADADLTGFRPSKKGLAAAVGGNVKAIIRASVDANGADFEQARLQSPTFDVVFKGFAGLKKLAGALEGKYNNLSALSILAGRRLRGDANLAVDVDGNPSSDKWIVGFRAQAKNLSLGDPMLDRIAGGALALKGRVDKSVNAIALRNVSFIGRGFEANAKGELGENSNGIQFALKLAELARIEPRLRGPAEISGQLTGKLDNPNGLVEIRSAKLTAAGKPVRDLLIKLDGKQLLGALRGELTLGGLIDGRKLSGGSSLSKLENGGWRVSDLGITLGSAKIEGGVDYSAAGLLSGDIAIDAPQLQHLSALLLANARGALTARVVLDDKPGRQNAKLTGRAKSIAYQNFRLGAAQVDFNAEDLFGRPKLRGTANVSQLRAAGERIGKLKVTADGDGTATRFTALASGGTIGINTRGSLRHGAATVVQLDSLTAVRRSVRFALAAPASLRIANGSIETKGITLRASGGRIALSGRAGQQLALNVKITALPLSIAQAFKPGLSLAGRLNGSANLRGTASNPTGTYTVNIRGLANRDTRKAGLPRMNINLGGQLMGSKASVKGRVTGGRRIALQVNGTVPLSAQGSIALSVKGRADAALANAQLAGSGQRVAGKLAFDVNVRGTTARPAISGSGSLRGGSFRDPIQGISFTGISGRFAGRGDRIIISRLTARTPGGGSVSIVGSISTNASAGLPANLTVTARKAQLISNPVVTLVTGLNLKLNGALMFDPVLSGSIDIRSMNVNIPERLPASAAPLKGAKHIAPPRQTRARLKALAREARVTARRKSRTGGPRLNLRIDARNQIFVRGRGIDAELGGSIRVTGTTSAPRANGGFDIRRGRLDLLTQRIEFTRGKLRFLGDIMPELDFIAQTTAGGVTAQVLINGPASKPRFTFTSTPALPPDEVLSRLLFEKASGSLTPFQAVQLAAAVATLSGKGGPGILDKARRALGVDTLDVGVGEDGPTVGASRYISRRISVGVKAGAKPENSGATVKIDLNRRIKLLGEVGGDGRASVGIAAEIEY